MQDTAYLIFKIQKVLYLLFVKFFFKIYSKSLGKLLLCIVKIINYLNKYLILNNINYNL
jgi:hypothetical protein